MWVSFPLTLVLFPLPYLNLAPPPTHTFCCQERPVEHAGQLTASPARTQLSTINPLRQNVHPPGNFTCHLHPRSTCDSGRLYGDCLSLLKLLQFTHFHLSRHAFPKWLLTPRFPAFPSTHHASSPRLASTDHTSPHPPGPTA